LFKRRKPDEVPAGAGGSLPAGLSAAETSSGYAQEAATHIDPHPRNPGGAAPGPVDSGLGVPPFRPAQPKEAPSMARPPFPASPGSPAIPPAAARPGMPPNRAPAREPGERRTLVVGRGISVQGTVQDAERLVVEGTVEASMIHATELSIALGGVFKGEVEVEDAEIAGTIDGTVTVRGSLVVRATGRVLGTARCRRLQVEDGGQITGRIEMLGDQVKTEPARTPAAEPAV
jgi:cytoskeletal protein CcmA (bactofilin family)